MPPSSPWIFICPSSRGIGHALTRRLLLSTMLSSTPILATTRHRDPSITKAALLEGLPDQQQQQLSRRLYVVRCDVVDEASIAAAAARARDLFPLETHHLRLACALPGVLLRPEKSPKGVDAESVMESFRVNSLGPLLLAKHFFDFLPRRRCTIPEPASASASASSGPVSEPAPSGQIAQIRLPRHATWLNMSARVGSTTDNRSGGWFSYRASKAAVNSLTRSLDIDLRMRAGDGAMAVAYHPGTVRTGFSRDYWGSVPEEKLFSPEYAAERLVSVVCSLETEQRGRCWDWKGDEVPP